MVLQIFIPEGICIKISAMQEAESLIGALQQCWTDVPHPSHKTDSQLIVCRDQKTLLHALDLDPAELFSDNVDTQLKNTDVRQ